MINKKSSLSSDQIKDTGLVLVLICLLVSYLGKIYECVPLAIVILLLTMVFPEIFRPVAFIWFGFSNIIGTIASKIVLSGLFFLMITPVGIIMKIFKKDSMSVREWKKGTHSVFKTRDHKMTFADIEAPF